jgi:hypothetical protein
VGHPEQSLPDVVRTRAVCAQYRRPAGVTFSFQVCEYTIEPTEPDSVFNLFAKHNDRAALPDKPEEFGPEVSHVVVATLLPGLAERLARTASSPNGNRLRPSGETKSFGPSADASEEMVLSVAFEVFRFDFVNTSLIDKPLRYQSLFG